MIVRYENFLTEIGVSRERNCLFCSEKDSLLHIFFECHHIQPLLAFLNSLKRTFSTKPKIPPWWFILNPPKKSNKFNSKRERDLFIYLICTAKMSIHLCRRNKRENIPYTDPKTIFKDKIATRLKIEFAYFNLVRQLDRFSDTWSQNEILCKLLPTNELEILI